MSWVEHRDSTVSVFPGFMLTDLECPECGHTWTGMAAVGVTGIQCPACLERDDEFVWIPPEGHPDRVGINHDGCWLTGDVDLGEFDDSELVEMDEPDIFRFELPLWLVRLIALVVTVRQLFGRS